MPAHTTETTLEKPVWTVQFLGAPAASCGDSTAHLRSKKTWALLACLLLPSTLHSPTPIAISREVLADRFWEGSDNRRVSLCMALASIRSQFQDTNRKCLKETRQIAQAEPGWFVTDIAQVLALHAQARTCAIQEERLRLLGEAAGMIRGEFLEGCFSRRENTEDEDEAHAWYLARRAEIHGRMAHVLMEFSCELEAAGDANGAFEVIMRILHLQPHSSEARQRAWALANLTGQAQVVRALDSSHNLEAALARLALQPQTGHGLTPKDQDLFRPLVRQELDSLPEPVRQQFLRLTFLPAAFSAELAKTVCRVPPRLLAKLVKTPLLVTATHLSEREDRYCVPAAIRESVRHLIPTTISRQMHKRLGQLTEPWLLTFGEKAAHSLRPFGSLRDAEPFLALTLDWSLKQPATPARLAFMNHLRLRGLSAPAARVLPYFEQVSDCPTDLIEVRVWAAIYAGHYRMSRSEFTDAEDWFQKALAILAEAGGDAMPWDTYWPGTILQMLALATHYKGDSQTAVKHLKRATRCFERIPDAIGAADCLRLQCEIQNRLREYPQALVAVEGALQIRRNQTRPAPIADALFWKASTLRALDRPAEAVECLEEALEIWQETGDQTGIGHCLREMGTLYAAEGRYGEARAHLEHAIAIHERTGSQGCRIAAVTELASIFFRQGRFEKAQVLYAECLADSEARHRPQAAEAYREKLAACAAGRHLPLIPPQGGREHETQTKG